MTDSQSTSPPRRGLPSARLPVLEIVRDAYATLWTRRDDLLRLAMVPALVSFALYLGLARWFDISSLSSPLDPPQVSAWYIPLSMLGLIPAMLFITNWLRVLLFDSDIVRGLGLSWGMRETRMLIRWLLMALAAMIAAVGVLIPLIVVTLLLGIGLGVVGAPRADPERLPPVVAMLLPFLGAIPAVAIEIYVMLRLSLALPATAEDETSVFRLSWSLTRRATLRLFAVLLMVLVPFYVLTIGAQIVLDLAGLSQAAPFSGLMIYTALGYITMAAGMGALALAYVRLNELSRTSE